MRDEVARRLVHASGTLVPVGYLLLEPITWTVVRAFLVVGTVAALVLETVRLLVGLDWIVFDRLTREYEQDNLAGYALYAIGMTTVALAFEPRIGVPAMLMLTIADPISGLLSSGELKTAKQTFVLLVTFGVSTFIASLFVTPLAAVFGGLVATLADGVKPVIAGYVVDDNLTIPIGAAVAMFLGVTYLPATVF
ncbi:dolichol kinase [Haloarculaceae archaeon H-GB11]|nr:dolichol kinase [Haloarculaceae archaeon H-GB11]